MFRESSVRSFIKMFSWRLWATLTTMIVVYIFTGRIQIAVIVGGLEIVVKMALYYVHERAWDKIKMGRHTTKPFVLWFTGSAESGREILADRIYDFLSGKGCKVERLDSNTARQIFPETGSGIEERNRQIERAGLFSSILERNGVIVVCSLDAPYKKAREFVRGLCRNFVEIYVSASAGECGQRGQKRATEETRAGQETDFTETGNAYEPPAHPQITIDMKKQSGEESVRRIREYIGRYL